MATMTNDSVVRHYVHDLCNGGLNGRRYRGGTVYATADEELIYSRRGGASARAWGPVTLCSWNRKSRLFIINGDGFTDRSATSWQTYLRNAINAAIENENRPETARNWAFRHTGPANGARYLLAPFMALNAAGIDRSSIQVREMQEDRFETVWHPLQLFRPIDKMERPPQDDPDEGLPSGWTFIPSSSNDRQRLYETTFKGDRWRFSAIKRTIYRHKESGAERGYIYQGDRSKYNKIEDWVWATNQRVHATPEFDAANWATPIRLRQVGLIRAPHTFRTDPDGLTLDQNSFGWADRIHHLGASVFSARGPDGKRHLYVSAFDEQERRQQMYYLAQLPDRVKTQVNTYREAIQALAPPLVHKAWKEGIPVYRQGDVFAIETDLTDEQVYQNARSRVRRSVALAETSTHLLNQVFRGEAELPMPAEGEVRERVTCELCHDHRRWAGNGEKAKRSLSIYRTGHTATEVVVSANGTTYISGIMYHDPQIEEPGRTREHEPVNLFRDEANQKWCLALRNTVPRRKVRRAEPEPAGGEEGS